MNNRVNDIMKEFKAKQELVQRNMNDEQKKLNRGFDTVRKRDKKINTTTNLYDKYQLKLQKGKLDKFSSRDIIYFMQDCAKNQKVKCVITNYQVSMHQINLLKKKGYDNEDILAMIEFLYTSGQPYIDLNRISPSLLISTWGTTIYADTQLWLKDEYDPNNKNKRKSVKEREWQGEKTEKDDASIEWGF